VLQLIGCMAVPAQAVQAIQEKVHTRTGRWVKVTWRSTPKPSSSGRSWD
jgi:hypothetical protein